MSWLSSLRAKYAKNIHFGTILLVAALLLGTGGVVSSPVNDIVYTVFHYPFVIVRTNIEELLVQSNKEQELTEMLVETSIKISLIGEAQKENKRLREMLEFQPPTNYSLLASRVVATAGERLPILVTINKGSETGVEINQTVINQYGLVGKVNVVNSNSAIVELLTSQVNRVAARITSSRDMGIIKYNFEDGMTMEHVPVQSEVKTGDTVISSGLGGIYQGGFLIGIVEDVERIKDNPFCIIKIKSSVNFNSIEELFLIEKIKP